MSFALLCNVRWLAPLLILAITFAVHAPSIGNDFVFDDRSSVMAFDAEKGKKQEMIATLHPLSVYFSSHYLRGAAPSSRGYRPVTVLSYALTFHLFSGGRIADDSPTPHHAINVALKTLNTLLVLLILARLCPGMPALLGALVFGLHSIQTEVVAGIVGRGELLGFCFGATSLLLYLRGVDRSGPARIIYAVLASLSLFLAFCSKESAIAWFAFLPVLRIAQYLGDQHLGNQHLGNQHLGNQHPGNRNPGSPNPELRHDLLIAAAIGIIPAVAFLALYTHVISNVGEYNTSYLTNPLAYTDALTRIRTAVIVWAYAIYKLALPFSLASDYGANVFALADSFADSRMWLSAGLLLTLLIGGFALARRHPLLFLSMACFFGFSFIVSNVPFAQETIYGERTYYTPALAISLLVAWLFTRCKRPGLRYAVLAAVAAWSTACGVVDVQRMLDWRDNDTLFVHDAFEQPRSIRLLDLAADAFGHQGRNREKREMYIRQLEIEPEFPKALLTLASEALQAGRPDEARALLDRCRESRLLGWIDRTNHESLLYFNMGMLMKQRGDPRQAIAFFERSMATDPGFLKARFVVGRNWIAASRLTEAEALVAEGETHDPEHAAWRMQRGKIAFRRGRFEVAARLLSSALPELDFNFQRLDDWLDLVEAMQKIGQRDQAARILEDALRMGGNDVPPEDRKRVDRLRR